VEYDTHLAELEPCPDLDDHVLTLHFELPFKFNSPMIKCSITLSTENVRLSKVEITLKKKYESHVEKNRKLVESTWGINCVCLVFLFWTTDWMSINLTAPQESQMTLMTLTVSGTDANAPSHALTKKLINEKLKVMTKRLEVSSVYFSSSLFLQLSFLLLQTVETKVQTLSNKNAQLSEEDQKKKKLRLIFLLRAFQVD